jgi:hypothetical protein
VYQVVMLGAALLAVVPKKWVRIVGFVLLLAGVFISMAVGLLYLPTFFAFVWVMVRDERPPVQFRAGKMRTTASDHKPTETAPSSCDMQT